MIRKPATQRKASLALLLVLASPVLTGSCGRLGKDDAKCTQALKVARQALEQEQFELVRQWRRYAYKHCADQSDLAALDEAIRGKRADIAKRDARNQRAAQIAKLFATFATEHLSAPRGQCFPESHPQHGWCKRSQGVSGSSPFDVEYRQQEPDWVRFDTTVEGEVKCGDFGGADVRSWRATHPAGGVAKRSTCSLSEGRLRGYSAYVSAEPDGTRVSIVSPKYLSRDAAFRRQLETEGK